MAIQQIFGLESFNSKAWLDSVSSPETLKAYLKAIEGEKNFDRVKKTTLESIPEFMQMKDQ